MKSYKVFKKDFNVSQAELHEYYISATDTGTKYNKIGTVEVRLAQEGEKVKTVLNGKKETENVAKKDDVIIKNPDGEVYTLSMNKFKNRYSIEGSLNSDFITAKCTGSAYAVLWNKGRSKIQSEFDDSMLIEKGDYLAKTNKTESDKYYRIEKGAFANTYRKA